MRHNSTRRYNLQPCPPKPCFSSSFSSRPRSLNLNQLQLLPHRRVRPRILPIAHELGPSRWLRRLSLGPPRVLPGHLDGARPCLADDRIRILIDGGRPPFRLPAPDSLEYRRQSRLRIVPLLRQSWQRGHRRRCGQRSNDEDRD
jgi:hypothetical protein